MRVFSFVEERLCEVSLRINQHTLSKMLKCIEEEEVENEVGEEVWLRSCGDRSGFNIADEKETHVLELFGG